MFFFETTTTEVNGLNKLVPNFIAEVGIVFSHAVWSWILIGVIGTTELGVHLLLGVLGTYC